MNGYKDPFAPSSNYAPREEPKADPEQLVSGTATEVLEWVDNKPERAQKALDAEKASEDTRVTLVAKLEKILDNS